MTHNYIIAKKMDNQIKRINSAKFMERVKQIFKWIKGRKTSYLIAALISITLLILTSFFLLNCMIEYKYNIDHNLDQAQIHYTYSSRKLELDMVMWYLKGGILYLFLMILFFVYQFEKK